MILLTSREICEYLRISPQTLWRYRRMMAARGEPAPISYRKVAFGRLVAWTESEWIARWFFRACCVLYPQRHVARLKKRDPVVEKALGIEKLEESEDEDAAT